MFDGNLCKHAEMAEKDTSFLAFTTAAITLLLCLLTVTGNTIVCLAIYKDPYKDLRCPFAFYILHLSVADLIAGLVYEPISVTFHIREGLGLHIQNTWVIHMSYFISCTASILSVAALTFDRYIAVSRPFQYRAQRGSRTRAWISSAAIWTISFTVPFAYFKVGYFLSALVFANTAIILTMVIIIIIYVKIQFTSKSRVLPIAMATTLQLKMQAREKKVTNTFLVMLMSFVLCYIPSCIMIYVLNFCSVCSCDTLHWLGDVHAMLVLVNSFKNPLIYAWRLVNFRKAFVAMVTPKNRASSHSDQHSEISNMGTVNVSAACRNPMELGVLPLSNSSTH